MKRETKERLDRLESQGVDDSEELAALRQRVINLEKELAFQTGRVEAQGIAAKKLSARGEGLEASVSSLSARVAIAVKGLQTRVNALESMQGEALYYRQGIYFRDCAQGEPPQ